MRPLIEPVRRSTASSFGHATTDLVICEGCDAVYPRQPLARKASARCRRCGTLVQSGHKYSLEATAALALTALLAFICVNAAPIVTVELGGDVRTVTMWEAALAVSDTAYGLVMAMVGATLLLFPLLEILLLLWVLLPLLRGRRARGFSAAMRMLDDVSSWSMIEVFVVSLVVALAKLLGLADVRPGAGAIGLVALLLLVTMLSQVDHRRIWDAAERAA